jgi:hypothetical protein
LKFPFFSWAFTISFGKLSPALQRFFWSRNSFVAQLDESHGITTQLETNSKPLSDTAFPRLWRMLQAADSRKITTPRRPENFTGDGAPFVAACGRLKLKA